MKTEKENLKKLVEELSQTHSDYVRLPESLILECGIKQNSESSFGCSARLKAIYEFLPEISNGTVLDIGGNCGYFVLSLLESKKISKATIIDHEKTYLNLACKVASAMNLDQSLEILNFPIDMGKIRELPFYNVIICQNLLHHAGSIFDKELVNAFGWGKYAREFLEILYSKCELLILCMSFENGKPKGWLNTKEEKDAEFLRIIGESGWKISHHACVFDLVKKFNTVSISGEKNSNVNKILLKRSYRNILSKISIISSSFLGKSKLANILRNSNKAKIFKKSLQATRSVRSDHYFLYLLQK